MRRRDFPAHRRTCSRCDSAFPGANVGRHGDGECAADFFASSGKADLTLEIAPVTVELAPDRILSTIGYNGPVSWPRATHARGQADDGRGDQPDPTSRNLCTGTACSFRPMWMASKNRTRHSFHRRAVAATASRRARRARAGITPTPWRMRTCTKAPIPDSRLFDD